MTSYLPNYGPEQRAMVERWLDRMRKRFAGARGAADIGRVLARERHLETLNQPLPMSAQRFARLQAELADVQGEGAFLLVVDCGETGTRATRFVRRFETLDALQQAKRGIDAERCGAGCWRNHLLYQLTQEDH
jgi:glutathione S-transferase